MFYDRLQQLIKKRGITKKQFCEDVQINKNLPKYWQDNNTYPNRTILNAIATYFGVSVEYLKCETDDPTPPQSQNIKLGIDFGTSFSYSHSNEKSPADAELNMKCIKVAEAYRNSEPLVQSMVDRILKIDEAPVMEQPKVAARGDASKIPNLSAEEISKLPDLEDT